MAKAYRSNYAFDHGGSVGRVVYDYAGAKITGVKTTARKFTESGLPAVKKNDTYLNTDTGCWYTCTEGGAAKDAKWKYSGCRLIGKPRVGVTGLSISRATGGSRVLTATWKVPDALLKDKAGTGKTGRIAAGLRRRWTFDTDAAGAKNILDKEDTSNEENESCSENLASFSVKSGSSTVYYTRASFYPYAGKPKLRSVTFTANPYNAQGDGGKKADGKTPVAQSATYAFDKPRVPTVSPLAFDAETGAVSGTVTTDAGEGRRERLWTEWELKVTDTSRPKASQTWKQAGAANDARTSIPFSYDAQNYQSLTGSQYIRVHCHARARGFAGDSAWSNWSDYYVAFPNAATIDEKKMKVTSKGSAGKVVVPISVNATVQHPTDSVKLQKLANVAYSKESQIPGDAAWDDTGSVDDGRCTALVADVADLMPDAGMHTWVRVKSWHGSEESLHTYSKAVEVKALFVPMPSAADDECKILRCTALPGGESVEVVVGYDGIGQGARDDADGTLLEWSDDVDAWRSTEAPKSAEIEWRDDVTAPEAADDYRCSQTVKVKGLDDATTYWFRARRYMDGENGKRTYGPYGEAMRCTTATLPGEGGLAGIAAVALSAPASIRRGAALELSWTFAAAAPQDTWYVLADGDLALAQGEGAQGACTVPWERLEPSVEGGRVAVRVRCVAAGEYADSNAVEVGVSEPPALALSASTLTAQPLSFSVESDVPSLRLSWAVRAEGCSGDSAAGGYVQAPGDVVAGGALDVALEPVPNSTAYRADVTIGGGMAFHDGAGYAVEAVATDPSTGMASGTAEARFSVDWAHKAPMPSEECSFEPVDGDPQRSVAIALVAPQDAAAGDVYDVYRVTHDGADLVSRPQGLPLDHECTDSYAPFGDVGDYRYRVACRTPDGDEQWSDYSYSADYGVLRFDFANRSVELPYDVAVGDSWAKDSEIRSHMDGGSEGFWNDAVTRTASLSTDVLRVEDPETAEAVRALAQHAGPVFVRTPDGSAYEADVQVRGADTEGPVLACTFDAQQVSTTPAFMLPLPPGAEGEPPSDYGDEVVPDEEEE